MASRDPQQCESGTIRAASILFPIAQRVDADAHGPGKLRLSQAYESTQCGNILPGFAAA